MTYLQNINANEPFVRQEVQGTCLVTMATKMVSLPFRPFSFLYKAFLTSRIFATMFYMIHLSSKTIFSKRPVYTFEQRYLLNDFNLKFSVLIATKVFSGMSIGFSGTFIVSKVTRGNGAEMHNKNWGSL